MLLSSSASADELPAPSTATSELNAYTEDNVPEDTPTRLNNADQFDLSGPRFRNFTRFWYYALNEAAAAEICGFLTPQTACATDPTAGTGESWDSEYLNWWNNENGLNEAANVCNACTENEQGSSFPGEFLSHSRAVAENVMSMTTGDQITYFFAVALLGLQIACEWEQIRRGQLLLEQRAGHLLVRLNFYLLNTIREFVILPMVVACVPTLCAYMGADSLSIIFVPTPRLQPWTR